MSEDVTEKLKKNTDTYYNKNKILQKDIIFHADNVDIINKQNEKIQSILSNDSLVFDNIILMFEHLDIIKSKNINNAYIIFTPLII